MKGGSDEGEGWKGKGGMEGEKKGRDGMGWDGRWPR
jgi:hypothetical protein